MTDKLPRAPLTPWDYGLLVLVTLMVVGLGLVVGALIRSL